MLIKLVFFNIIKLVITLKFIKVCFKFGLWLVICLITLLTGLYVYAYFSPSINIKNSNSIQIYDNENSLIYQGSSTNKWVSIDEISDDLINAMISVEDKNFYKHLGFDYLRIAKAMYLNVKNKSIVQGASTISQQYVKNLFLDFDQTWERKIDEAFLTLELEMHYSKEEILEGYLNTINFGQGNYGIEAASNYYFNKHASELSLEEAIMLAGIPKNPSNFNPVSNYDNAVNRALVVAKSMVNNEVLDENVLDSLYKENLTIYGKRDSNNLVTLMYYQDAVMNELNDIKSIPKSLIESGGLKIYTNLDIDAQTSLENAIKENMLEDDVQVASIMVEPSTGKVIALVGGRDYAISQYNRVTSAKRQIGSTIKPFLYYTALEQNMTSASTFKSEETTFVFSNNQTYSPTNYANSYANSEITMAAALAYSDNIYAVKTHLFLGEDMLVDTLKTSGLQTSIDAVPSLALGATEVNMFDWARAYSTLASGGDYNDLYFIERIEDSDGNILYEKKNRKKTVLNTNYVYILNEMMRNTYNSSFISYNYPTVMSIKDDIKHTFAIKSGTTDYDYWCVGYNPNILTLVWTGNDDNKDLDSKYSKITKKIWVTSTEGYLGDSEDDWYETPDNVVGTILDAVSGGSATNSNKSALFYFLKGTEPSNTE